MHTTSRELANPVLIVEKGEEMKEFSKQPADEERMKKKVFKAHFFPNFLNDTLQLRSTLRKVCFCMDEVSKRENNLDFHS